MWTTARFLLFLINFDCVFGYFGFCCCYNSFIVQ
nr:MAG TPA: hypothetical protein [Caudoviricetes sp.]